MYCGIHKGGFLSLLKYTAFIDPLIREIEESGLGYFFAVMQPNPVSYADDMSVCTLRKHKMDLILKMTYDFSCRWRYTYNARKSAIMVYGESPTENRRNRKYRVFRLGQDQVREEITYDHVGVKACLFGNFKP